MADESRRVMALLGIRTVAESILKFLPRSSLKSLRLSCKALDELVLQESYLFSRVYLSSNYSDIQTLEEMAGHPRINRCVTTLIWDVCTGLDFRLRLPEVSQAVERIASEYGDISDRGLDFCALMAALPRLPRLRAVVFTNLMGRWAAIGHNPAFPGLFLSEDGCLSPSRLHFDSYESPAMRRWRTLRVYPLLRSLHNTPAAERADPDQELLPRLWAWAEAIQRESRDEQPPLEVLEKLRCKSYRAPLLCLVAFEVRSRSLQRISFDAAALNDRRHYRRLVSSLEFKGFDIYPFHKWDPELVSLSEMFRRLQNLCLCLDNTVEGRDGWNWRNSIRKLLESAGYLQRLELRLRSLEDLGDLDLSLLSRLEVLVLDSFLMTKTVLEEKLLPWAFQVGLRTLLLIDCPFAIPHGADETDIIRWLAEKDISMDEQDSLPPSHYWPRENSESESCIETDASDSDSITDPFLGGLGSSEDPRLESEDEDMPRLRFMDIDFGPEPDPSSDTDSNSNDSDSTYFPYTEGLWSLQLDAPLVDTDAPGWKDEMTDWYYKKYHDATIRKYDHSYDDDTPGLEEEYPMPPLRAAIARVLPSAYRESFLFLLDNGKEHGLWLRVDDFTARTEKP
ncbi:hypothetical protein BJX63DRAFT_208784 [Aspergillus granulosus]|uniref:F-box domain-containing protein n=1 Tax=Aspergillus granulosus TaxID=176169 RepID=A0ABR4HEH2_9EURO